MPVCRWFYDEGGVSVDVGALAGGFSAAGGDPAAVDSLLADSCCCCCSSLFVEGPGPSALGSALGGSGSASVGPSLFGEGSRAGFSGLSSSYSNISSSVTPVRTSVPSPSKIIRPARVPLSGLKPEKPSSPLSSICWWRTPGPRNSAVCLINILSKGCQVASSTHHTLGERRGRLCWQHARQ